MEFRRDRLTWVAYLVLAWFAYLQIFLALAAAGLTLVLRARTRSTAVRAATRPRRPPAVSRRLSARGEPLSGRRGVMRAAMTSDLWWKNAVVYCLDVETFTTPTATAAATSPG